MVTTFDLKRNDALQNNLVKFLKYLAESLDILKTQEIKNVKLFCPTKWLHYVFSWWMWSLYSLYERKWYEESKKWKILDFIHVHYRTTMQNSKLWLQVESHEYWLTVFIVGIKETKLTTFDLKRNDALQNNLLQLLKYLAESFDNLENRGDNECSTVLIIRIVTSCIAMVKMWSLYSLFDKEIAWKFQKKENIEFYKCTL